MPPLVARAKAAAEALDFARSCRDADGRLLHVLAGRRAVERVAEIGTGTGVGTAWLASALPPGVPLLTAERDERLAGAAAELFAGDPDVEVLQGDWREVLPPYAPFDLIFVDVGRAKDDPMPSSHSRRRARRSSWTTSRPTGRPRFAPRQLACAPAPGGRGDRHGANRARDRRGRPPLNHSSRDSLRRRHSRPDRRGGPCPHRARSRPEGTGLVRARRRETQRWGRGGRGVLCDFESAGFEDAADFTELGINHAVPGPGADVHAPLGA